MTPQEKVITLALGEVGYLEKRSAAQLDDKTANAGSANYTKYARDLDAQGIYNGKKQGYAWCDVFTDWLFIKCFGAETALKMLCQPMKSLGAGVKYSAQYFKKAGRFEKSPELGDQIFFANGAGVPCHTGLVVGIRDGRVYTVEGNTSGASGVVANGGGVFKKSYALTYNRIYGYGRPDWSLAEDKEDDDMDISKLTDEECYEILTKAQRHAATLPAPSWAGEAYKQAVADGITDGTRPRALVSRCEAAIMAERAKR